jgi:23S rRNA (uridine2552-2'-O)-methyltransferase
LERQHKDPYVIEAKKVGYRSRAAFKLAELDDRFHFLRKGATVVDLGAAPGGWSQVAMARSAPRGRVVAIDVSEMAPLPGVTFLIGDFRDLEFRARLVEALGGSAEVVLSDMAAPATGHAETDHLRVMALVEEALDFAEEVLVSGGVFVAKVLQGGTQGELLTRLKRNFRRVRHAKPRASRPESRELYVVAQDYRGKGEAGESRS